MSEAVRTPQAYEREPDLAERRTRLRTRGSRAHGVSSGQVARHPPVANKRKQKNGQEVLASRTEFAGFVVCRVSRAASELVARADTGGRDDVQCVASEPMPAAARGVRLIEGSLAGTEGASPVRNAAGRQALAVDARLDHSTPAEREELAQRAARKCDSCTHTSARVCYPKPPCISRVYCPKLLRGRVPEVPPRRRAPKYSSRG